MSNPSYMRWTLEAWNEFSSLFSAFFDKALGNTVNFDGVVPGNSNAVKHYGECSTAAGTAGKIVACTGFTLIAGAKIAVKFTVTNTAANPTLNVNSTGAKPIYYRGAAINADYLTANGTYQFVYNGSQYDLVGDINTDTNTAMTQNVSTADNTYPVLLTPTANATTNQGAKTGIFASGVKVNPSTSEVIATKFTGNVIGNVFGSSGSCTGNAATASKINSTPGGSTWVAGATAGKALVSSTATGFGAVWNMPVNGYRVACGALNSDNVVRWYSVTKDNVSAETNTKTKEMTWNAEDGTLKTDTFSGALNGNAATATKLKTARTINIQDSSATNTGTGASFDGSGNATIKLPATIKADVTGNCSGSSGSCTGNAATATKATGDKNGKDIATTYLPLAGGTLTGNLFVTKDMPQISVRNNNYQRGTAPTAKYNNPFFMVKQNNNGNFATFEHTYDTDMSNKIVLRVYPGNVTAHSSSTNLTIGYDGNGNPYTEAPTPADNDNSTKIATTAWVNSQCLKEAVVGQSSPVGDPWYKVCSYTPVAEHNETIGITFYVESTYFQYYTGILRVVISRSADVYQANRSALKWVLNDGFTPSDFVLVVPSSNSAACELWAKLPYEWFTYKFVVMTEGVHNYGRKMWTMYHDTESDGYASIPTAGTQIVST